MFRPSAALLPSRSFAGLEKRLVAALFCLAGRSGKRNENESDETSSIPPNFQSEAVQRAAVWVRCTQGAGGVAASWMDAGTELGQRDGAGTWGHIHVTLVWTRSPAHTVQGLRRREKDWGTESAHSPPPRRAAIGMEHQNILHSEPDQPMGKWWQMGLFKGFQQEVAASTPLSAPCRDCGAALAPCCLSTAITIRSHLNFRRPSSDCSP